MRSGPSPSSLNGRRVQTPVDLTIHPEYLLSTAFVLSRTYSRLNKNKEHCNVGLSVEYYYR